ncbi:unnamed protein product [Linum tenue]|uniref:S-protein homolog n=1 Tax=Linum tenue TaxID=586396 RepID=A0AAV0LNP7_9ROSI|nr:unnamed protein product [Linum tenue]
MRMRRAVLMITNVMFMVVVVTMNAAVEANRKDVDNVFPLKKIVIVRNRLKAQVKVHCKSKDDDLGVRVLGYNESFHFKFWTALFFRTLFYCSFEWPGSNGIHWFDIYDDTRNHNDPKTIEWLVKPFGVCMYDIYSLRYDICTSWKK